jgi:sugar phosphate isomerase/epimerase
MRLSASTIGQPFISLEQILPIVRQAGFDAVELSWLQVQQAVGNGDAVSVLRGLLDDNQLTLSNVKLTPISITDDGGVSAMAATLRKEMAQVHQVSCTDVSIRTGPRREQSLDLCALVFNTLLPTAQELGLRLKLSNAYGTRVEQLEDWRSIALKVTNPHLHALIDCGQFHAASVNPRDALRELGDRTGYVRIGDRIGKRPVPLGQGESNVPAIIEHLQCMGYAGWLSVESLADPSDDKLATLTAARQYLAALI